MYHLQSICLCKLSFEITLFAGIQVINLPTQNLGQQLPVVSFCSLCLLQWCSSSIYITVALHSFLTEGIFGNTCYTFEDKQCVYNLTTSFVVSRHRWILVCFIRGFCCEFAGHFTNWCMLPNVKSSSSNKDAVIILH